MLWLACVGITNAHVHHWLDVAGYSMLALELQNQVQTMFPPPSPEDLDSSLLQMPPPSWGMDHLDHPIRTCIVLSEHGHILAKPNYHFFLLYHQFLWDAMVYLEFVAKIAIVHGVQDALLAGTAGTHEIST